MLKHIDIAEFSAEVHHRREQALAAVGTAGIATYREALRVVCDDECWKVETQPDEAPAKPTTFEEFYGSLSVAARRLQQYGASDAQVRLLASLAVKQQLTLSQLEMSTLSKGEASAIIDHMKREG